MHIKQLLDTHFTQCFKILFLNSFLDLTFSYAHLILIMQTIPLFICLFNQLV